MRNAGKIMTVAAVAAALAACSPPNEQPSDLPPGADPTPSQAAQQPSPSAEQQGGQDQNREPCTAEDVEVTQSAAGEGYEVSVPQDCTAPTELLTRELQAGTGPAAAEGDQLDVDYSVIGWSDGEVKETSFGELGTLSVQLGDDDPQFTGWNEAMQGAQEGTRRLIIVPETMGFAQESVNPLAEETLVVVAEVVGIDPQP